MIIVFCENVNSLQPSGWNYIFARLPSTKIYVCINNHPFKIYSYDREFKHDVDAEL